MLSSLAHLSWLKVFFLFKRSALVDFFDQRDQIFVNNLLNFLVVMDFLRISVDILGLNEITELYWIAIAHVWCKSELALHFEEDLVDFHELRAEVWPKLDQLAAQIQARSVVSPESDITFPKAENLAN